jgi:hypothetical protein
MSTRRVGVNVVSWFEGEKRDEIQYMVLLQAVFKFPVCLPQ